MNPYSKLLEQTLSEIEAYSESYKGKEWPQDWYVRMKELITKAASEKNQNRAEELIDMVSWSIIDSGPFDLNFAPSFNYVQEALVRARTQREISKHKKA